MSIQHCFPNCRCFRFKTNCWSTNMCWSGVRQTEHNLSLSAKDARLSKWKSNKKDAHKAKTHGLCVLCAQYTEFLTRTQWH